MIVEFAFLTTLLTAGLWVTPLGLRPASIERAATAFLVGTGMYIVIGVVLVVAALPTHPYATIPLTFGTCIAMGLITRPRSAGSITATSASKPADLAFIAGAIFCTAFVVVVTRWFDLVRVTPDSYDYSTVAGLIYLQETSEASFWLLHNRLVAVGTLHAPAALNGEHYVTSITPAISIALVLLLLSLIAGRRPSSRLSTSQFRALAITLLAAVVVSPMFMFQSMYINGHMIIAAMVLLAAGTLWRSVEQRQPPEPRTVALVAISVAAVSFVRPEGGLLAALILLPFISTSDLNPSARRVPLAVTGAALVLWHAFLLHRSGAATAPFSVVAMLGVGAAMLLAAGFVGSRLDTASRRRLLLPVAGSLVVAALIWLSASDPSNLKTSWVATFKNLSGSGDWGYSMAGMLVLGILLTITRRRSDVRLWFATTMFLPMMLVMAYLREVPYRVGPGDSLNRSWLHILPVAALVIVSAVDAPSHHSIDASGNGRSRVPMR